MGLAQVLGPFATNTSFFVGYRSYGLLGGLLCEAAFIAPSLAMVIFLSWLYFARHTIPALAALLAGVGPVVIALILNAAWAMGRKALASWPAAALAVAGAAAGTLKVNAVWVLLAAGLLGLALGQRRLGKRGAPKGSPPVEEHPPESGRAAMRASAPVGAPLAATAGAASGSASMAALAMAFFKTGLVFFGGGFVLIPILHQRLVEQLHWLTPQEFLDGVAISNLTPGPIAVLATFAGFHLQGVTGAILATAALFAPALVVMALLCMAYERLQASSRAQDFLAGVTPVVVGLIVSAAFLLWHSAIPSWRALLLAGVALLLLARWKWHPAFVLALGAALAGAGLVP